MMKITGLSHLFKWENLHNWWLTKYFFAPLYIYIFLPCVIELVDAEGGKIVNKLSSLKIFLLSHMLPEKKNVDITLKMWPETRLGE